MKQPILERITRWVIARFVPTLAPILHDRTKVIESMRHLNHKLEQTGREWTGWRARALSAERTLGSTLPKAMKDAVREHDEKHSTCLRYSL